MEQLQLYLTKAKDGFWTLISKIESSVIFERLVSKYEALPTRNQKTIKAAATVLAVALVSWFVFSPLVKTRFNFSQNRSFFSLVSSMKMFNSKLESARKEYVPPVGWQNISANDFRQLEDSIASIMATLGLQETQYEIALQGSTLLVHSSEATIKQLESFMFQIDGLFPRFSVVRNKTTRHPDNKELIQFEVEIALGEVKDSSQAFNEYGEGEMESGDFEMQSDSPGVVDDRLSLPPASDRDQTPTGSPTDGTVPGFDAPTFTPLDDESDEEFSPSNPSDRGGDSEFVPPMGDDFIPPPPNPSDDTFEMAPIDDGFPPQPPIE